jgi:hypothetical protein
MRKKVGLWIDHSKAVVFSLSADGAEIKRITSELKNNVRTSGEARNKSAEEHKDNRLAGHLNSFYDEVLSCLRDAESILIFGPGEAKLELKRRLETMKLHGTIVGIETVDKMTDNQVVAKVRQRFLT